MFAWESGAQGINQAFQEGALESGIQAEVSACAKARPQGEADVFGKEQRSERGAEPRKTP